MTMLTWLARSTCVGSRDARTPRSRINAGGMRGMLCSLSSKSKQPYTKTCLSCDIKGFKGISALTRYHSKCGCSCMISIRKIKHATIRQHQHLRIAQLTEPHVV